MLSDDSQREVICRWLAGLTLERVYTDEDFFRLWKHVWRDVHEGAGQPTEMAPWETVQFRISLPQGRAMLADTYRRIWVEELQHRDAARRDQEQAAGAAPAARRFPSLFDIGPQLRPVEWLWKGWMPRGMITVLAARPGVGKSLVALDYMRMIIGGLPWPDGQPQAAAGRACIYVDAENIPSVLHERAQLWERWGMDRRLVFPMLAADDEGMVDLSTDAYRDRLWDMCDEIMPALVVVDSLRDILPGGERDLDDVKATLKFLSAIAGAYECALLVIHHLRKRTGGQLSLPAVDLDDVSGSGYITGHARVVQGLVKLRQGGDKNGPRKLEVVKTNLSAYPADVGIELEQVPPDGLRLIYGEVAEAYEEDTGAATAADWLLEYLEEHGASKPRVIIEAAAAAGFSRAAVYKARSQVGTRVSDSAPTRNPRNEWSVK